MKRLNAGVKYPEDYRIQPGDVVEILTPTKDSVGVYVAMDAYKGDGPACSMCVLSRKNSGNLCPMPFSIHGWRLCSITNVFLRPVETMLEDL